MKIDTTTLLVRASGKKQNLFVEKVSQYIIALSS